MHDLLFLIPLIIGLAIIALGMKLQLPKGPAMNRPAFGLFLVAGAVCWWISGAILLTYQGKFYFMLSLLTILTFFLGLANFVPPPRGATRPNQFRPLGNILIALGFILGLSHSLALMFTTVWPAHLLQFHDSLGLHQTLVIP